MLPKRRKKQSQKRLIEKEKNTKNVALRAHHGRKRQRKKRHVGTSG
jgi:hypothetical protein